MADAVRTRDAGAVARRLLRRTALLSGAGAVLAWLVAPGHPRVALGVLGGGVLGALAVWALAGAVRGLGSRRLEDEGGAGGEGARAADAPGRGPVHTGPEWGEGPGIEGARLATRGAPDGSRGRAGRVGGGRWAARAALVKFFTRHAILALVAYGMMTRLHLDPVGMIVGVTSVVVAAAMEAARPR